jgi:hypothetical protein
MKIAGLKIITIVALCTALAGCDTSQGVGRFFAGEKAGGDGPDEFGIVPTKPLELPEDFVALPEPTPGGGNLTDPLPEHDAVAALGGQPSRLDSTRIGAGEGALLAATERNGTAANIRTVLADEDKEFRKNNGPKLLERWFKTNTYLKNYSKQAINARRTNELLRRNGVKTPSVYPEDDE